MRKIGEIAKKYEVTKPFKKQKPFLIDEYGKLWLTTDRSANLYLTYDVYQAVKGLSESTSEMNRLLEKKKDLMIQLLKGAIQKVKKENIESKTKEEK